MSRSLFENALAAEGVTGPLAELAFGIYSQESGGGKNTKTSNRGAVGGMQVIPSTFREVADKDWDISNPEHNARAGIRYLKKLNQQAGGNPALTAAGYYGGPGGMEKARRGIGVSDPVNPHAPNTLEYGQQVLAKMRKGIPPPGGIVYMRGNAGVPPAPQAPAAMAPAGPGNAGEMKPGAVPLPTELLEYLASRNRAPVMPAAQNAWLSFLDGMQKQGRAAPVQAQDLDYTGRLADPGPMRGTMPSGRVDFSPFAAFGGLNIRKNLST